MRILTENELCAVAGGTESCTPENTAGNVIVGVADSAGLRDDLINIYESVVAATSHMIERVVGAL